MTDKMNLVPEEAAYSADHPEEVVRNELDGGAGRYRHDIMGASAYVNVSWALGPLEYQYFTAFLRTGIANGSEPFLLDLILDHPLPQEYTCYFTKPPTLGEVKGLKRSVKAKLEVRPQVVDEEFDQALIDLFGVYGEDSCRVLNLFHVIVNVNWPEVP